MRTSSSNSRNHKAPKARLIPAWGGPGSPTSALLARWGWVAPGSDALQTQRAEGPIDRYIAGRSARIGVTIASSVRNTETGQAFVELALVLPLFVLLIVGAAELGRLAYAAIEVNNAARAGVAYAAQSHTTASDSANIQAAATQDAPDVTTITATPSYSCSCETAAGAITAFASCDKTVTNLTSCPAPKRIVVDVTVKTTAPINTLFHLPGIPNTLTLRGQAIMRVTQ